MNDTYQFAGAVGELELPRPLLGGDGQLVPEVTRAIEAKFPALVMPGIDGPAGHAIVQTVPEEAAAPLLFAWLVRAIATLIPQDGAGSEIREVRDRGTRIGQGASSRYSDSRQGGSLHTDGAQCPLPAPTHAALMCVRAARRGGRFVMISVDEVISRLDRESPGALRVLCEPLHFHRRADVGMGETPTTRKPVFYRHGGRWAATYLREYIEAGHAHPDVAPLTRAQRVALDALDSVLDDRRSWRGARLAPGQIIIWDNLRFFHGRTSFEDWSEPERKRLLLRAWLSCRPASANQIAPGSSQPGS